MNKMGVFSQLQNMLLNRKKESIPTMGLTRKKLKQMRAKRYKPAFSMGFRGFPKTYKPCGMTPAPTHDQVRNLERKYNTRLLVKQGLLFFKEDSSQFSREEAEKRQKGAEIKMARQCNCSC